MEIQLSPPLQVGILGGFGFLALATVFTFLLRISNPANPTPQKVMRIIGGWWIIAGVLAFALLLGLKGLVFLFLIVSLLGLKEFLSARKSEFVNMPVLVALSLLTVAHYGFILFNWKNFFLFIVPVMGFIYLPFFFLMRRKVDGLLNSLWATQSALMLCVYFLSFVPGLIFLNNTDTALRAIDPLAAFLFLFLATELNDVFQFLSGKLFGRHKVVPELSPNKTLEGFAGGVLLTTALSVGIAPFFLEINLWQSALLGACLSVSGMSGDLMFSAVKRTYGVKDFSDLIPGHGGVLDRVDSLVFTAPTLYCLMYIFIR
jgi:phosphatidate cytidylyltransferase